MNKLNTEWSNWWRWSMSCMCRLLTCSLRLLWTISTTSLATGPF